MGCWKNGGFGRWHYGNDTTNEGSNRARRRHRRDRHSSGNSAFDDYREETLRRLEDEQAEFEAFLERLRHAKDKAEFEQFMAERRGRTDAAGRPDTQDDPGPQPSA